MSSYTFLFAIEFLLQSKLKCLYVVLLPTSATWQCFFVFESPNKGTNTSLEALLHKSKGRANMPRNTAEKYTHLQVSALKEN